MNEQINLKINKFLEELNKQNKQKVAFCLKGAVSKFDGGSPEANTLQPGEKGYINYLSTFNSIKKHIFETNVNYDIDTFIHCWNEDLKEELIKLYKPKDYIFEANDEYIDEINMRIKMPGHFAYASQALSIKKVIQLKEKYERINKFKYDIVVIYRPDTILIKDMKFDYYNFDEGIYTSHFYDCIGEFHFLLSNEDSRAFKGLYDSFLIGNEPISHYGIKNFIINFIHKKITQDDIVAGQHQEVARPDKMAAAINLWNIDPSVYYTYGMTNKDIGL